MRWAGRMILMMRRMRYRRDRESGFINEAVLYSLSQKDVSVYSPSLQVEGHLREAFV